ncbi:RHS repeat-associated core domain-containing protein [Pseudomonas serbica]|jgi:RHS repeat-associated protein|uniref:RHS repeat-associated core domain-containing protein n=1 Tax=Pseudomonas serbica TaxID=2965074 RepID=UPI00237BD0E7|nr:RHS repeat-associated core domain-containing protein [Pseudomonas serbica]
MLPNREALLCRYHYDPLDRLINSTTSVSANTKRFYLKDRLATEIQGAMQRSIMQHEDKLLAQQHSHNDTLQTRLLATDQQCSVLNVLDAGPLHSFAYTPYGHRALESGLLSLLGFNGERPDSVTGCYLLGNGYRAFNPVLMRFNSPDSWSPFWQGGLNAYAYCGGDPRNQRDPTGHSFWLTRLFKGIGNIFGLRQASPTRTVSIASTRSTMSLADELQPPAYFPHHAPPSYTPPSSSMPSTTQWSLPSPVGRRTSSASISSSNDSIHLGISGLEAPRLKSSFPSSPPTDPPTYSASQTTTAREIITSFAVETVKPRRIEVLKRIRRTNT